MKMENKEEELEEVKIIKKMEKEDEEMEEVKRIKLE